MGSAIVSLLSYEMNQVHGTVKARLEGLTDDEFFWEPVPRCWTVRRRRDGEISIFNGRGEWIYDYAIPDPEPPPFTTIGWRLIHIACINDMYHERVLGPQQRDYEDQEVPHTATDAINWWHDGYLRYQDGLTALDDAELERLVATPWGVTQTVREWTWTLIHENAHHGAEIGCLRDLYREVHSSPI
jgi:hypothetical protein